MDSDYTVAINSGYTVAYIDYTVVSHVAHTAHVLVGNIFYHRPDLQAFNKLPPQKRNPYHIKMEDEGPYGNDEIRCFVLSALSTRRVRVVFVTLSHSLLHSNTLSP